MFVVTYNFNDMPVNHMTFLRQRIFLVPVEEGAEGKSEASAREHSAASCRPKSLCYLMHLRYDQSLGGFSRFINDVLSRRCFCLLLAQIPEFQIWEDLLAQRYPPAFLPQIHRGGRRSPL